MWRLFGNKNAPASAADVGQEAGEGHGASSPEAFRAWGESHAITSNQRQGFLSTRDKSRLDEKITSAARSLGDGVQKIVLAAKSKEGNSIAWKSELLSLLGSAEDDSDINTLLKNTSYENFVGRCVENELPPNLIHCMRLLRVVELQHAAESDPSVLVPVATIAASKVSKLLCAICVNAAVGEQLRPHLFGLLALSGASYPVSGVHVAQAASDIVVAVADKCLSRQLVWFIHDRKMILHMTDDVKELCGISQTESSGQPVPKGLRGADAEEHGLWLIALTTIVKLLVASCRFHTVDLIKDFEEAGGYDVLQFAIKHGTSPHGGKVVELLSSLASCPTELTGVSENVASNIRIFEIIEEVLVGSNPLLREHMKNSSNKTFVFSELGNLSDLAKLSIMTATRLRLSETGLDTEYAFDATSALLSTILQLFSDHSGNYERLEGREHVLSYYVLAFPCFSSDDVKLLILKTLEFVLTGIEIKEETMPVKAYVEIFFLLAETLVNDNETLGAAADDWQRIRAFLFADLELMGSTLEKLLQFDQRVAPLMSKDILTVNLPSFLDHLEEHVGTLGSTGFPPAQNNHDKIFRIVCNVVKLLVSHQISVNLDYLESSSGSEKLTTMHRLLKHSINELGNESAHSAASVYEVYMSSLTSLPELEHETRFLFGMLDGLAKVSVSSSKRREHVTILDREIAIISIIRSVLETKTLMRKAFRTRRGFECLLLVVLSWEGSANISDEYSEEVFNCLRVIFSCLDAALGMKTKSASSTVFDAPVALPCEVDVDPLSSQLSIDAPGASNRYFVRQRSFYIDLAAAIFGTGIMHSDAAANVLVLCMHHVDPDFELKGSSSMDSLRNPDAVRLVLQMAIFLSESVTGNTLGKQVMERVLWLCEDGSSNSSMRSLATCGLASSLTNPNEFATLLFDGHQLQPSFLRLLCRLASFSMSFKDFVGVLRSVLGPLLVTEGSRGRIILPVISSSVGKKITAPSDASRPPTPNNDKYKEGIFCDRLRIASEIAMSADQFSLIKVGGDSVNSIGVLMHGVKVQDRLRRVAEEGRLSFLEISSIDSSALRPSSTTSDEPVIQGSNDKLWSPLSGSGFTYSVWLRHGVAPDSDLLGNLYILDICSPATPSVANQDPGYLSIWYDMQNKRFTVVSSDSYRGEPTCFPVSPLAPNVWHHILLTYSPSKRTMMSRKSCFCLFVDGRALEAEVRIETVNLPPDATVVIGAPNPTLAASGIIKGRISHWDLGPCILFSTVLLDLDATAIHACGPNFPGLLWGDRPQRMSLAAASTLAFSLLAEVGEPGSIANALKRRNIQKLEGAGYSTIGHQDSDKDDLSTMGLLCMIPPECVVFAFQAPTATNKLRHDTLSTTKMNITYERLVNLARLNFSNENAATDAVLYGRENLIMWRGLSDSLYQAGGPSLLIPLVNAAPTPRSLACSLRLIRQSTMRHAPNLECMQVGGGYRILALLIKEKGFADISCLDECLAFAVMGFPPSLNESNDAAKSLGDVQFNDDDENSWVLSDVDAMKHLLLNHQVWDLQKCGPAISLRLLSALNVLVSQKALHKSFNARRLHLVGIIRWALHLMIEGAELYSASELAIQKLESLGDSEGIKQVKKGWYSESPLVSDVMVGGDPGNRFLLDCKKLLRRVLTFMLTPGDLEALADGIIFTLSISGSSSKLLDNTSRRGLSSDDRPRVEERMLPGPTARLYLVRLLEELIVDGVNEIVASSAPLKRRESGEKVATPSTVRYHSGGVASPNQPYLTTTLTHGKTATNQTHPKHQQAQAFLSAFSGFLTPIWFATVLEGCHEEATASATLRLLILMLQGSSAFESIFITSGGFSPFVLSVPRFSTCSGITLTLLSELLNVPILHLPFFSKLDSEQLCEVFDNESSEFRLIQNSIDPSSDIFGLIAECIGRNIKYMSTDDAVGVSARETNAAIIDLIAHRHEVSPIFQTFCTTRNFLEPLSQALCLVYNERLAPRSRKRVFLSAAPRDLGPTERFVGRAKTNDGGGIGMVRLLRMVILDVMVSASNAALVLDTMFQSFPIHASAQQVEALHLILIEQCKSVVEEVKEYGDSLFLANCVGLCSVLLNQLANAFFTAEASLEAVNIALYVLGMIVNAEVQASASLNNSERTLLILDAAHITGLTCVAALKMSLSMNFSDPGDEDLQAALLALVETNIDTLLLVQSRESKSRRRLPSATGTVAKPPQNSRLYPIWQSASLVRCLSNGRVAYPDITDNPNSHFTLIAPLIIVLQQSLTSAREDIRGPAVSILVALLQHRMAAMSELLVAEIKTGNQIETIDVVNRGGFRALLTAHEAALVSNKASATASSVKRMYSAFFEWFERNQSQVDLVFKSIDDRVSRIFPEFSKIATPYDEAIENQQKKMLMKLTAHSSDNAILGGIERGELARRSAERTTDSHARWKRQGFDDLAYGATRWKILLRQLKGSGSIWEGGPALDGMTIPSRDECFKSLKQRKGKLLNSYADDDLCGVVKRWKLDLSGGHEQQRRRLLPNYEFHGIYNLEGNDDPSSVQEADDLSQPFFIDPEMEATTELLKDLKLKRAYSAEEEEEEDEELVEDTLSKDDDAVAITDVDNTEDAREKQDRNDKMSVPEGHDHVVPGDLANKTVDDFEDSSSYGLITGLLQPGDWPEKSYNVRRCTGLEVTKSLLLWCQDAIYIIDGFEQVGGAGMDGKITRVEREQSSFNISLRPKDFKLSDEKTPHDLAAQTEEKMQSKNAKQSSRPKASSASTANDVLYQHRSQRISFSELYSVFRRRYQLQHMALEFYDIHRSGTLVAFATNKEREEVLAKVLQTKLPRSIFNSSYGNFISYTKFMNNLKAKIISQWMNRKISNFEFLMHLNSFAGRSFNDLTQYPVFPWCIADYESEELDLDDPKTYRDLSKPMGAIGEQRAQQFRERYDALASTCFTEDDPPPFHYGTHYSCAAYVLYYLMRLEPFSRLALALQGGRFDVADRLFHDVGRSWKSASSENLQDVRELIPEFFYLPDFLRNTNHFDFGETQRGKTVHDVSLPKWAKGDPQRFVRINRQALESEYVSRNLHHWIDLIFGYKQRGKEAVEALNVFVHVTYEGQVDLDAMKDPVQKASIIAQIQNFGQTPSRLERRPFPQRIQGYSARGKAIDIGSLQNLIALTPPFCILGAPNRVSVECVASDICRFGLTGQQDMSVGDIMLLNKSQIAGIGRMCALIMSSKKYLRFGGLNNGISIHSITTASRSGESNRPLTFHDGLHFAPITAAKVSLNGDWFVTGSVDSTLKIWRFIDSKLVLQATLCGHEGSHISCIDISTEFGVIASGCGGGRVRLWDLRTFTFVRSLQQDEVSGPAISVSVNNGNGNVVTLVGAQLSIFDINGCIIARLTTYVPNVPTCAVATDCPEWMEKGVAVVTGHKNGEINFWSIDYTSKELQLRAMLDENPHKSVITALRIASSGERQDTLLAGDSSGALSVSKTRQLESLSADDSPHHEVAMSWT